MRWPATLCALLATVAASSTARAADAPERRIAVVSRGALRHMAELRGEISSSAIAVVSFEPGAQILSPSLLDALSEMTPALRAAGLAHGLWVLERGNRVALFSLPSDGEPSVHATFAVPRADALARRRLWVTLVERLRMLLDAGALADPGDAHAAAARAPARVLVASQTVWRTSTAAFRFPRDPVDGDWMVGAASAVGITTMASLPTAHVVVSGHRALGDRWDVSVRGLWPVYARRVAAPDTRVRMWTFGALVGAQARLGPSRWRTQPFAGVAAGAQILLSDADIASARQSRLSGLGSVTASAFAGLRVVLTPQAMLVLQLEAGDAEPLASSALGYERDAADARFATLTVGVLFNH